MAKKSKARKLAAQENSKKISQEDDTQLPSVLLTPGYFPFASYTSVVGVHTTLLAFATLFLPRTTEFLAPLVDSSTLTSKDRPQHPFLDALTLNPAVTLACICVGAAVLQSWWGGWVRAWGIDFALQSSSLERQIDRARLDARKFTTLGNAWVTTAAASLFFHFILVFFGAPLASHIWQTYLLALLLSILAVFPPAYTLGSPLLTSEPTTWLAWVRLFAEFSSRTPVERAMLYPAVGTLLGCWLGTIPIALDWDRPWQAWPLTPALGAVAGYILSSIAALTANAIRFFADEHLRALHAAKIKTS
ncbi:GPI biosynthesis protein family Pig-F-domain-containing protein [Mycena rosella]|uniref:GPI biosynthesis protein family Pig-F-domain-containing protein n=1 Tax=Mycena rosella TaxID=1033263 RepID=A0AAD7GSV8_MYCRO|nr:GPI biosynthesis protein family Pig-F-domain-containing protein [Mycena rosella]